VSSPGRRAWRWIAGTIAALAIVSALLVGGFRLALGLLPEYQSRVAETVRAATGLGLLFDSLDARIGRYGPEVYFAGARIVDPQGDVLVSAAAGRASLSLWRSAWFRRLEIGRVILESPRLNLLVFPDRHIELVGQARFARPPDEPQRPFSLDRLPRGLIEVRDATLAFRDLGAGDASWELTHAYIELRRQGGTIALDGEVELPARLGRSVQFEASASGDLTATETLAWRGRVTATDIDLSGWAKLLPETFPMPAAGSGSFRLSARGTGRSFERGRAVMQLNGVALHGNETPTRVTYTRLAGDAIVEHDADRWRVSGSGLEFSAPGARWEPTELEATLAVKDGQPGKATLRAGFIRVENLAPLLALLPDGAIRERLEALAPRGILRDVDLAIVPAGPGELPDVRGAASFEDAGFAPLGRAPGVHGIDGTFEGHGPAGVLHVDAEGVDVDWPARWQAVMPFTRIGATIELSRALGGVRIAVDDAQLEAAHGEASGRLRMLVRPGQAPLMDLDARARLDDVAAVAGYIPRDRLGARSLEWLDHAFIAGRVRDARVQVTGPTQGFPYREGQGRFLATAEVEDLTLDYAPGWPPLTGMTARAEFSGASLRATAATGTVGQMTLRGATAEVRDWLDSLLLIRADATADAGAVHAFLASSPLAPRLGSAFPRLSGSGPIEGEVVMYLPLRQFADHVITVHGRADGVSLALDGVAEPATGIEGEFWVRNGEFQVPGLTASLLGGDVKVTIASEASPDGDVETRIDAHGTVDGSRLPRVVRLPLDSGIEGRTTWRGSWTLRRPANPAGSVASHIRLDSDLLGLASKLPAPLDKNAAERRPLELEIDTDGGATLQVRAGLGRDLRTRLELRRDADHWQLARGTVRLGGGEIAALPVAPGLGVDGQLAFLSISDLTSLRWPGPARGRLEDLLTSVRLEVARLEVLGYEFAGVSGLLRPGNRAWDVDVTAPAVKGRLRIPYSFPGEVALVADLDRLHVSPQVRDAGGEADPARLPDMQLDVRDVDFLDWRLGHLAARLTHVDDGIRVEEFSIRHASFTGSGSGSWRGAAGATTCALQLELDSTDVSGFLEAMALARVIEAKNGKLVADVTWPGGPDSRVLERISGTVRMAMTQGRVLTVEPGAGRILGLMSLSHLGKRLSLDFKDLTGEGMAFDSVKGDFTLASGDAFTDNLTLRGSAAEIGIAGRTSLRDRTYDQTAVVTGDLGASLGVAGALAGGPAVGAALLLFSQIFKEPLKGVARAYYRISGPWEDPTVKKIDARELGEAAGIGSAPAPAVRDDARG
jgi:uncharacterized protein (TIGR02099 family)